jgi:hypothetical protein
MLTVKRNVAVCKTMEIPSYFIGKIGYLDAKNMESTGYP